MEAQQGGWSEDNGGAEKPKRVEKEGPKSEEQTVRRAEVGCSSAEPLPDHELVFEEQVLGEDGPNAARFQEPGRAKDQVDE